MQRSLKVALAACSAGLIAGGAAAQSGAAPQTSSSVNLYGLVGVYAGRIQPSGMPSQTILGHGGLTTSYFGVAGREDLGGGLSAVFALEAFFQPDNGLPGRSAADPFFSRNSYLGFDSKSWGRLTLGRQTNPTYVNMGQLSAFGVSTVFSPLVLQSFVARYDNTILGDTVWNNAVQYSTPRMNGLMLTGVYALGEVANRTVSNQALHANYSTNGLTVGLSAQRFRTPLTAPMTAQTAYFGGAAYDFKVAKVFATTGRTKADGVANDTRTHSLGAQFRTSSAGMIMAEWARTKRTATVATTRNTASLGYDHFLSKRTDVYVVYSRDKLNARSVGNSYALGIRHTF